MSQIKPSPIPERKQLKPHYLKGDYAAGQYSMSPIHGYNRVDQGRKDQFLQDGRTFLHSVGEHLRTMGFTEQWVQVNHAGIAVAGSVYARFFRPATARHLFVAVESSAFSEELSPREDSVTFLARWEQDRPNGRGTESGPNCWLNPNFSSASTARCLVAVLETEGLMAQYWWWQEDGTRLSNMQWHEQDYALRWAARRLAEQQRQAWQPIVAAGSITTLRDDYTTTLGPQLHLGTTTPHLSPGGEETFLDRDLHRDARRYLEALGTCLAVCGFTSRRVAEEEEGRFVWADYKRPAQSGQELQLRVKIGPVSNRDLITRYDHVVIYSCTVPFSCDDPEAEATNEHVHVPTNLDTPTLAQRIMAQLSIAAAVQPTPVIGPGVDASASGGKGALKRKRTRTPDAAGATQTALF